MGSMNMNITCSILAGRLPNFLDNWKVLTQDTWMLQVVQGYCIDFTDTPHQSQVPPEMHVSTEMHSKVTEEITELLNKGAVEEVQPGPSSFISQLFL